MTINQGLIGEDELFDLMEPFTTSLMKSGRKMATHIAKKDIPLFCQDRCLSENLSEENLKELWDKSEGGRIDLLSALIRDVDQGQEKENEVTSDGPNVLRD